MLITAPRRSAAVPSPNGSYALYTISTYSLDSHLETKEIRAVELKTGVTSLITDDENNEDPIWFSSTEILWLRQANGSITQVWIGTIGQVENAYAPLPYVRNIVDLSAVPTWHVSSSH